MNARSRSVTKSTARPRGSSTLSLRYIHATYAPIAMHAKPQYAGLPASTPRVYLEQRGASHLAPNVPDTVIAKATDPVNIFNLGADEYCRVDDSLGWISERLGLNPKRQYAGGARGWIGDSPFIFLDTKKIQATGWKPKLTIEQGIVKTLRWLEANRWVYEARH